MSRCLKERDLIALLDDDAAGRGGKAGLHLGSCEPCCTALARLLALRAAAREAMPAATPDWSRVDRGVERAIRDCLEPPRQVFSLAPFGLAAAAAALIVVALLVPDPDDRASLPNGAAPELSPPTLARAFPPILEAAIIDTVGAPGCTPGGPPIGCATEVSSGDRDLARASLGAGVLLEISERSAVSFASIAADTPTVILGAGALRVDVPAGSIDRDLVILAQGATFAIFAGCAEFAVYPGEVRVTVTSGEVAAIDGAAPVFLGEGRTWRRTPVTGRESAGVWFAIDPGDVFDGPDATADLGPSDHELLRLTGSLPKRVVLEVMERARPKLAACYESSLKRFPSMHEAIPVTARLSVGERGQVARVRIRGSEEWPILRDCLARALKEISFPPPEGGPLEIIYPLRLSPRI